MPPAPLSGVNRLRAVPRASASAGAELPLTAISKEFLGKPPRAAHHSGGRLRRLPGAALASGFAIFALIPLTLTAGSPGRAGAPVPPGDRAAAAVTAHQRSMSSARLTGKP
jgi:hypothetical protein